MPRFDYKKAKADGYTDEQIKQFLDSKRQAGVDVWIDKADVQPAPSKPIDPLQYVNLPIGSPFGVKASTAIDNLPTMLGAVGNVPLGPAGAALYGGAGELLRRSLRGLPLDPKAALIEGGTQGLWALGGAAAGLGAQAASEGIGPAARLASRVAGNPAVKRLIGMRKIGLPLGGMARGGIPGAMAGMAADYAAPYIGRAAFNAAVNPRTAAFLGSEGFKILLRTSPQAALAAYRRHLAEEADATQTR